eukprot:6489579-Amphidinium_carterae.2
MLPSAWPSIAHGLLFKVSMYTSHEVTRAIFFLQLEHPCKTLTACAKSETKRSSLIHYAIAMLANAKLVKAYAIAPTA